LQQNSVEKIVARVLRAGTDARTDEEEEWETLQIQAARSGGMRTLTSWRHQTLPWLQRQMLAALTSHIDQRSPMKTVYFAHTGTQHNNNVLRCWLFRVIWL